jgi:RNase P/RNase MRP subunit POP5
MVRIKYRYILGEIIFSDPLTYQIDSKNIYSTIAESAKILYGDLGYSKITEGFSVKYWNTVTNTCIIRVGRSELSSLMGVLILTNSITTHKCKWRTLKVSGTLSRCELCLKKLTIGWIREKERYKQISV